MSYFEDIRREYISKGLTRKDLSENPFTQFDKWMNEAIDAGLDMPNAMSLATSSLEADNLTTGDISLRTVLLKSFDENGFVFFTNYDSKKATQINSNPKAALLFPWLTLDRQIKISGRVEKISKAESLKYFLSRPLESRIAATSSNQSKITTSRNELMLEFNKIKQKFKDGKLPLPDSWGGYRVVPSVIEFWQGQKNRLHDRFEYKLIDRVWQINRLNP
jgi:pyridoxamine 5'-phosphate oxidase